MSKTILITGASSDFGRAAAETLKAAGHRVVAAMRDPSGRNRERANALWAQAIHVLAIDVTCDTSVEQCVHDTLAKAGHIDVLVNNASITSIGAIETFSSEQAQTVFNNNVVGLLRTIRAVVPAMRGARDGLIVNIGSVLGRVTVPYFGLHSASKAAVEAISEALQYELRPFSVETVVLQPSADIFSVYKSAHVPADDVRVNDYCDTGHPHDTMLAGLTQSTGESGTADATTLAKALLSLVDAKRGSRPDRLVVGRSIGADQLNRLSVLLRTSDVEYLRLDRPGVGS
jgi:NAD(P)-dependent dehydrogenase (short-subunit alcohol dehydrogenase family)